MHPGQLLRPREEVGPPRTERGRVDAPDGVLAQRGLQAQQVMMPRVARVVAAVAVWLVADEERHVVPRARLPERLLRRHEAADGRRRHQVRLRDHDGVRKRCPVGIDGPVAAPVALVYAQIAGVAG